MATTDIDNDNDRSQQTAGRRDATAEPLMPRLVRGAVGGFVFGLVFLAFNMWFVASMGNPATNPLKLISSLVLGQGALEAGTASPFVGFLVHAVLSMGFGVVFALLVPRMRTNGTVALAGGLYGGALYLVNFLIIAPLVFPQFATGPNDPFEAVVHIVFGHALALAFYSSGVRRGEPKLSFA